LPNNDPGDHGRYIELEAARIVETLRHLRDEYRSYFEERGCHPIPEMYWVVVRHGVKDWAIMALRSAAIEYIAASQVSPEDWKALFDFSGSYNGILPPNLAAMPVTKSDHVTDGVTRSMVSLRRQDAFDQIIDGSPFGREYQIYLARSFPGPEFEDGVESFPDVIERRQSIWERARPWTEGLDNLFEVTQQEVFAQLDALSPEVREAENRLIDLS